MEPIEDYALLGDTRSAALVSRFGSIDWLCLPRFDSGSCFAALLDDDHGGRWSLRPADEPIATSRRYVDDTLVLETTFETPSGSATVVDCLPLEETSDPKAPRTVKPEEVLVRIVEGRRGTVRMAMDYEPRLDYGKITPWMRRRHGHIEAVGGPDALDLLAGTELELDHGRVSAEFDVKKGDRIPFLMAYHPSYIEVHPRSLDECDALVDHTLSFWRDWSRRCKSHGRWHHEIVRSLLTLKALTFGPSGGIVAAPTTSLPEKIGGERNWDYRYCWLRDATFTLDVLLDQGYTEEAAEWRDWLLRAVAGDPEDMQIMYGVLGERRLNEQVLDWLPGYEGSRPVRIGNAAVHQLQLDVYGELVDSFHSARRAGLSLTDEAWDLEKQIISFVCERWREPDEGIWEVRSGRDHFVHSKVMAWVAVDRGITAIEDFGREGPVGDWRQTLDEIRDEVLTKGIDPRRGCFKRTYDSDEVDASLLMIPLVGFLPIDDARVQATIAAVESDLMVDGLVMRYLTHRVDDGLAAGEGSFIMCTFWLVDCLAMGGRRAEAIDLFERTVRLVNDVGLLSEQYDQAGRRMLGNFPQAFSHVALVAAAMALETSGEAVRRGRRATSPTSEEN